MIIMLMKRTRSITKVVNKKDNGIFATKDSVLAIIKKVHVAIGHKGERRIHKKFQKVT